VSGICGICQPGAKVASESLDAMLSAMALPEESRPETIAGRSVAVGVSRKWAFQQVAEVSGVRIAVDADLTNVAELAGQFSGGGLDRSGISLAEQLALLYSRQGPGFVKHLQGAFSIAVWDEKAQRLVLAIDRLGLNGLYWSQEGDRLVFGSRAAAVRAALESPAEVDAAAIMQFLLFSVVPAPLTAYRGMAKLRPGTRLIYENGRARTEQYWDLDYIESDNRDEQYWAHEVREGIRAAVLRHLDGCSAESTGAYLSGGTDSSSVVAFMSERFTPVNTFSMAFPETSHNEIAFARTTAERFHTRHHERCLLPEDVRDAIPRIIAYYDEPFANSSALASYYCALLARESGVDTLLAGDGGDELFAGNSRYADDKRFSLYHSVPAWIRKGILEPMAGLLPANGGKLSLPRRYIRRANIPNPRRIFSYGLFLSTEPREVFEDGFLGQAPPEEWMAIADGNFQGARASSELNRLMYLDLKLILADNDLRKVSGTAELAGVRVRYPLLDSTLVELSARIPTGLKLKGFEKRYIFKQAMKGILPSKVLYKKKHGFGVPLGVWFLQDPRLQSLVQDVLNDPRTRQRGYFRSKFFDRLVDLHRSDHAGFFGEIIWYVVALELWHREHADSRQGVVSVR
jgi:asparagine synthase (glutamine-hydrolysing)